MDRFVPSAVARGAECLLEFHEDASWDVQSEMDKLICVQSSARTLYKVAKLHEVFEGKDMAAKLLHEFEALTPSSTMWHGTERLFCRIQVVQGQQVQLTLSSLLKVDYKRCRRQLANQTKGDGRSSDEVETPSGMIGSVKRFIAKDNVKTLMSL